MSHPIFGCYEEIMADDALLKNRLKELAERSYSASRYTYTNFLTEAELSEFMEIKRELDYASPVALGGNDYCERKLIRFGSPEDFGYEEPLPITALLITPLNEKFADDLSHRDFLGALMNLGIERETLGDIFVDSNRAILYCIESMAEYIIENLTRVRHTTVMVKPFTEEFVLPEGSLEDVRIQISSERIDAIIARVYKLSRESAQGLFKEQKVFVNSKLVVTPDTKVKTGDRVSVRGFGRFEIKTEAGLSKKGKINLLVSVYR